MKRLSFLLILLFLGAAAWAQPEKDSLRNILRVWKLDEGLKKSDVSYNDSLLDRFDCMLSPEIHSISYSDLGNIASANISDLFFHRPDAYTSDFSFNLPYTLFLKRPENIHFYNTRRPYTSLMHSTARKIRNMQTISVLHTQNINPYFNFGVKYDFIGSKGQYISQHTKLNSVSATANLKKGRHEAYFAFIFNRVRTANSGGFYNDTLDDQVIAKSPYMEESETNLMNRDLVYTHIYKFGKFRHKTYLDTFVRYLRPTFLLTQSLSRSSKYRVYTDDDQKKQTLYQTHNFIDSKSYDSIAYSAWSYRAHLATGEGFRFKKISLNAGYQAKYFHIFNFKEYIFRTNKSHFFENKFTLNTSINLWRNLRLDFYGDFFAGGYRNGNFRLFGSASLPFWKKKPQSEISLQLKFTENKPDYFIHSFYSNHYIWNNDFENEKRLEAHLSLKIPEHFLRLNLSAALLQKHTAYDIHVKPIQYKEDIFVLAAYLEKNFRFRILNIDNAVCVQKSNYQDAVGLPLVAARQSSYFKFQLIKNALRMHVGYQVNYTTLYHAPGFDPAAGHFFHPPVLNRVGNYPYISFFINAKIKKNVLLFFKFTHLNSGMISDYTPEKITDYPSNIRLFRFGVKWNFRT